MDGYAAKVTGGPAVFAGLLGAAPTVRDDLLDDALDGDVGALVAEALHACAAGSRDAVLLALTVVDRASIDDDCPALRPEAVRVLAGLCRPDQDVEVLVAALPLFGVYVPGPEAAQRLAAMTGHPVAEVRAAAVSGMEYFADEGSFPAAGGDFVERLARLLGGDPDAKVRLAAAEAFGMVETWKATDRAWLPAVVAALSRALDADPDPDVRAEAAENLAQMIALDDRQWAMVADTLRRHLDDADVRVAAWALARVATLGDPEALDRLWALVGAVDVHREYLSAATELSVSYRRAPANTRGRLRKELKRLRKAGWAHTAAPEPNWTPDARAGYLDVLISRLSRW